MIPLRRILVPTDFSDFSACALEHASAVAAWTGAEILVLHVVQPVFAEVPTPLVGDDRERLRADLDTFAVPAEAARVKTRKQVEDGGPVSTIVRVATEWSADLVVMGTHGRSGFEHFLLGSVTEKVVRKAPCPVLTVRARHVALPRQGCPYRHVLCPTDFSDAAQRAAALAAALAEGTDTRITLLHVVEHVPADVAASAASAEVVEALRRREAALADELKAIDPRAGTGRPAEPVLLRGKPSREIVHAALARGADLVVLGVHGHNPVHVAMFGSTAHAVLRDAPCAVLTVREKRS